MSDMWFAPGMVCMKINNMTLYHPYTIYTENHNNTYIRFTIEKYIEKCKINSLSMMI